MNSVDFSSVGSINEGDNWSVTQPMKIAQIFPVHAGRKHVTESGEVVIDTVQRTVQNICCRNKYFMRVYPINILSRFFFISFKQTMMFCPMLSIVSNYELYDNKVCSCITMLIYSLIFCHIILVQEN